MSKVAIFMADGCEEIEGLTVVDILRRAGVTATLSTTGSKQKVETISDEKGLLLLRGL